MTEKRKKNYAASYVIALLCLFAITIAVAIVSSTIVQKNFQAFMNEPPEAEASLDSITKIRSAEISNEENHDLKTAKDVEIAPVETEPEDYQPDPEAASVLSDTGISYTANDSVPLDYDTQMYIQQVCADYGVPYPVVLGVIETESAFQSYAQSSNSVGYMQINVCNAGWLGNTLGISSIYDPYDNIRAGVYMLHDLYNKYGDWHLALVAYNCGEGGAQSLFSQGIYSTNYSWTVLNRAESWGGVVGW